MSRPYQIIVYGGSGLAAQYIIKKLCDHNVLFAVSGRSKQKIAENIKNIPGSSDIKIIESSLEEIDKVTSQAQILINCAGPYIFSGEKVVESCLRNKTHYIDISGETFFIEKCISAYNMKAEENNVFVINCVGFDSVPADIGAEFLKKETLKSVKIRGNENVVIESILVLKDSKINKTTYESAIHGFALKNETKKLRRKVVKPSNTENISESSKTTKLDSSIENSLTKPYRPKVKKLFYSKVVNAYCSIFPGTDASVVRRSQNKLIQTKTDTHKCHYLAYVKLGGFFKTFMLALFGLMFNTLASFSFGRYLLLKFPKLFSCGFIKNQRPSSDEISKGSFEFFMDCKVLENNGNILAEKRMVVCGPDPGYNTTAICVTECAILLLDLISNDSNLNLKGGVITPASLFSQTDIVDRLQLAGLKFEIQQ
ncbi:hypothetical protein EDEG_01479 [Edhazardia aedis USNM 41457]|uniref:Saccharopine dehydrogenase NADP binding domain-containing protein n=1 Tax=Edhazardia aedis (strain USNM 41457) TaxID=1003232 RepID=J9DSF1_EDHAE|nr:hypothetical protein EDEG_01479 [Edhazardia aedis USNM 41457]|eukprot:EJW04247.1 hypothetical protein EDEG_01479 [Edhazardia aedis USNM 41457]